MKKIIMWCKKHNLPYTVQNIVHGKQRIEIHTANIDEYFAIMGALSKPSTRHNWKVDSHFYTGTIWIYNAADHEYIQRINDGITLLSNMFFLSLQDGKTQEEAKQIQYKYAVENGITAAFDSIYNR